MVINNAKALELHKMNPQTLKFGMDRILSEGNPPRTNIFEGKGFGNNSCLPRPQRLSESTRSIGFVSEACTSLLPCAGCISSLFRCCRSSHHLQMASSHEVGISTLHPLGAYSKVSAESRLRMCGQQITCSGNGSKRKRSWSRAVFSNLQRKGLEKRFQLQKYITKPDRRQLAATLGLTDAQVKVWFQNRRMKWRHTKESSKQLQTLPESDSNTAMTKTDSANELNTDSECESDIDVQTLDN